MNDPFEIIDNEDLSVEKNDHVDTQYIISQEKFILLSVMSIGLYPAWWMYKSWKFFQQRDGFDVMPILRAIFSIFFMVSLFDHIQDYARDKGYDKSFSSLGMFLVIMALNFSSYFLETIWFLGIASVFFFLPAFNAFNFARQNSPDINVVEQNSFNTRQIVLMVLGAIWWGLVLIGLYAVE